MNQNIEIKARVRNLAALRVHLQEMTDSGPTVLEQEDVFFNVSTGRLKLRMINWEQAELIFYEREDIVGPRASRFQKMPATDPLLVRRIMERAIGILGIVRKRRLLFLEGNARIHLDEVEGLGSFLEIEVVLASAEEFDRGMETAHQLMEKIGIDRADLIETAYVDMLSPMPRN